MSDEYDEDCPECGFNQKDQDERDKKLIEGFLEDLDIIDNIDWDKHWRKLGEIRDKYGKKIKK